MNKYNYYSDEKISLWYRTYFTVEAENQEAADDKVNELFVEENMFNEDFDTTESEYLYDTEELMDIEQNDGNSTVEVYSEGSNKLVYKNGE